ncbi:MAG: hypothetical protein J1F14_04730 [Treponema sp.]|nr:hypothetical protein [Treponema sp.]
MKKNLVLALAVTFAFANAFAYNPPFGGESIYRISNPELMSGAASASGGPEFTVVPGSIAFNPALTALEQRNVLSLNYTAMIDTKRAAGSDAGYGQAFQLGLIVPSKWLVLTGVLQGTFTDFPRMDLGNSLSMRFGVSKEMTDRLSVGLNAYAGFYMGGSFDLTAGVDLGALYCFEDSWFLKSPRLGVSFLNLGKPLTSYTDALGINGNASGVSYPSILTPRVSFAATFFKTGRLKGGFSADLSFPFFQNAVLDAALGFSYADMMVLSVSWEANTRELVAAAQRDVRTVSFPSIGLCFKFAINSSGISKANADWERSEIIPSFAWQNLHGGIQAFCAGARMNLGMSDTSAPEIILWDEE